MQPDPPRDVPPDLPRDPPRDPVRPKTERPHAQRLPKALSGPRRDPGRPARETRQSRPGGGRTVVAVLGSVAALGGSAGSAAAASTTTSIPSRSGQQAARAARRADPAPPGELALLGVVFAALTAGAPAIARPLLARGVAAETITEAAADAFVARLIDAGAEGTAPADAGFARPTPAAAALFHTVFDAIRRQLPLIARPLVAEAVAGGTITAAQARRIEERLVVRAHLRPAGLPAGLPAGHAEPLFTGRLP